MKLENLVPDISLCKRIPAGKFEDSALVLIFWHKSPNMPVEIRTRCEVENDPEFDDLVEDQRIIIYPAPTLEEILDELSKTYTLIGTIQQVDGEWHVSGWKTPVKLDKNPVTAALKLWLELEREKHEQQG